MEHDCDQGEGWQSDAYPEWKEEVVQYTLWSKEWDDMVANSKFKDFPKASRKAFPMKGISALQDHGYPIWFRQYQDSGIEVSYGLNLLI